MKKIGHEYKSEDELWVTISKVGGGKEEGVTSWLAEWLLASQGFCSIKLVSYKYKVQLSLYLTKHNTMKMYGGVEV
jgi:hypothetical protein